MIKSQTTPQWHIYTENGELKVDKKPVTRTEEEYEDQLIEWFGKKLLGELPNTETRQ